jgi:hypothetical protein
VIAKGDCDDDDDDAGSVAWMTPGKMHAKRKKIHTIDDIVDADIERCVSFGFATICSCPILELWTMRFALFRRCCSLL